MKKIYSLIGGLLTFLLILFCFIYFGEKKGEISFSSFVKERTCEDVLNQEFVRNEYGETIFLEKIKIQEKKTKISNEDFCLLEIKKIFEKELI